MRMMIKYYFIALILMQGHSYSNVAFLKKYYGENINNLMKVRQKRLKSGKNIFNSSQTLRLLPRPVSSTSQIKPKSPHRSSPPRQSQKKMFKKLSNQLKVIQQSIKILAQPKKKKQTKYKSKLITEIPEQNPKSKIYNEVLNQIQQIKRNRNPPMPIRKQLNNQINLHPNQLRTLFYGVDFIDGIQFKIKIQLSQQFYSLMAKNSHAKLLLQMSAKDYHQLQGQRLGSNPCNIFKYLNIDNNQLKLKIDNLKRKSKSVKCYLNYY